MKTNIFQSTLSVISIFLISASAFAQSETTAIQSLESQGVEIVHEFDAPMNLKGYIGNTGDDLITFYSTEDEKNVIVGTMLNEKGENISERIIQSQVIGPKMKQEWSRVENSSWVQDGYAGEQPVLYTFTDPNCPYCALFRDQINPLIESNEIQLRHIMVGILAQDSIDKAAMILESDNPDDLLHSQQDRIREGGISVDPVLVSKGTSSVKENNNLMRDLGFGGTPTTVFKDANGDIQIIQGAIGKDHLDKLIKESF